MERALHGGAGAPSWQASVFRGTMLVSLSGYYAFNVGFRHGYDSLYI